VTGTDRSSIPSDRLFITLLALITASGPVAMNIYLPALPAVQAEFGVSVTQANATISAPLLAFALGLLVYGPLSDRYGRRVALLGGLGIFGLGNLACLLAPTLDWLVVGRVLQSLGSAAGITVTRAMLGDLYGRERMARMLAYLTMVMVVGPTVAPLLGGALTEALGWHAVFAFMLGVNLIVAYAAWRWLPETRPAGLHGQTGADIVRASVGLLRQPVFFGYTLQVGIVYATFLTFISLSPYVMGRLGHPATVYGSWYLLVSAGYFGGNWLVTRIGPRLGLHRLIVLGVVLQFAGCAIGVALALAGLWHPAAIFLPMLVVGVGQGLALPNLIASTVALAPRTAGAASSLLGFMQQLVAASSVQAMSAFSTATPVPIYAFCTIASALALAAVFLLPQPARGAA
jgi:MFS transporter, DHA1 family, multidrug resistance protein